MPVFFYTDRPNYSIGQNIKISGCVNQIIPDQQVIINYYGNNDTNNGELQGGVSPSPDKSFTFNPNLNVVSPGMISGYNQVFLFRVSYGNYTILTDTKAAYQNNPDNIPVTPPTNQVSPQLGSGSRIQTQGEQFINSLSKDQYGILLSEDLSSSPSFLPPKSVVWYNDISSSVTLSSKLFNNVTILRDQSFSYTFDTPGVYWVHINGTLAKEVIQVYDVVNDCNIDMGCGNPDLSICKEFGQMDSTGKCISGSGLEQAVKAEFQRRDNVLAARQVELQQKIQEKQDLDNKLQILYKQWHSLDREVLGEAEFKKQNDAIQADISPLEDQRTQFEADIGDLQQTSNVRNVCVKAPVTFFTCMTETSNNSFQTYSNSTVNFAQYSKSTNTPKWTQKIFQWYDEGKITDNEMFSLVKWLIDNKIMGK